MVQNLFSFPSNLRICNSIFNHTARGGKYMPEFPSAGLFVLLLGKREPSIHTLPYYI